MGRGREKLRRGGRRDEETVKVRWEETQKGKGK